MRFLYVLLFMPLGFVHAAPRGLDVNDVSYIFPLDSQNRPFPDIPLSNGFLSKDLFNQVLSMGEGSTESEKQEFIRRTFLFKGDIVTDFSKWSITSFRYSNCGDTHLLKGPMLVQTAEPCSAYLRVVAQPVDRDPIDSALHLLYNLGPEPTNGNNLVLQKLLALRDESEKLGAPTTKIPLQIHPGLVRALEEPQNHFEKKVIAFIQDVLGDAPTAHLDMITMTATTGRKQWKFFGGVVKKDSSDSQLRWQGFNTPIFQNLKEFTPLLLECDGSALCKATPEVTQPGSTSLIQGGSWYSLFEIFRRKMIEQFRPATEFQEIAEIIDNPKKVNLFNTDCISCHETSSIRANSPLFTADSGFPLGITPFVNKSFIVGDPTFITNFGYESTSPRISVRTAAESAVIADAVNRVLKTDNPGYVCKPERQKFLWNCIMDPRDSGTNAYSCYEQFCE